MAVEGTVWKPKKTGRSGCVRGFCALFSKIEMAAFSVRRRCLLHRRNVQVNVCDTRLLSGPPASERSTKPLRLSALKSPAYPPILRKEPMGVPLVQQQRYP